MLRDSINFIKTPLTEIVHQGYLEMQSLEHNMLTGHIVHSLLDSVFLKVAGALEQKCQSIYWVLGNNEVDIRYELINKAKFGTFSTLTEKNEIFRYMTMNKPKFVNNFYLKNIIKNVYNNLNLRINVLRYPGYLSNEVNRLILWKPKNKIVGKSNTIFGECDEELKPEFDNAIYYRNLIAHNTLAAKKDKIQFNDMNHDILKHLLVLLIVDEIFIQFYSL